LNRLLVVFALLSIVGCKTHKQIIADKKPDSVRTPSPVLHKLEDIRAAQLNFTTFSGRAKAKMQLNNSSNDVTLNIRINHGQKIWVSITAIAGIEVARAVITPDSLLAVNKLQGLYVRQPFSYIYKYASSQLDYRSIEALLIGNAIPQLLNDKDQAHTDSTANIVLSGALNELVYKLIVGQDMKVRSTSLSDTDAGQTMQVDNSAFVPVANRVVASQIDINSTAGTRKIKISMHYIKQDFDLPLEYPFNIPSSYDPAK
jgi:Domain of unknown function (DUF4292)